MSLSAVMVEGKVWEVRSGRLNVFHTFLLLIYSMKYKEIKGSVARCSLSCFLFMEVAHANVYRSGKGRGISRRKVIQETI